MNTINFNPSNWSGNGSDATATITDLGRGNSRIIFRDEQFEASQYQTNYGDPELPLYSICDLSHEGEIIASACLDGNEWTAYESDGDLSREDIDPLVALLQVVANVR
jgi:hypothetical protein|tara:strand:+ start:122 stop:442 length:321 start_codon:yes stop_codon:yes gene_type:complete